MPVTSKELADLKEYLAAREAELTHLLGSPDEQPGGYLELELESARLRGVSQALQAFLLERAGQDSFAKRRST
jgi:hypothetical protein